MHRSLMKKWANSMVVAALLTSLFVGLTQINQAIDESSPAPMAGGDRVVTGTETWVGMQYIDGNVTVQNGGVLNVVDGGLIFLQDTGEDHLAGTSDDHIYYLRVDPGGTLNLDNSTISTQTSQIYDYAKLNFTVGSSPGATALFSASNDSMRTPLRDLLLSAGAASNEFDADPAAGPDT